MRIVSISLAVAALAFTPQLASAHTELVSSAPAANSTVASPAKIVLHFEEPIVGASAKAHIDMTSMPGMANHKPTAVTGFTSQMGKDQKSMTLLLKRALSKGTYKVTWSAAGSDTHRVTGSFNFTVK